MTTTGNRERLVDGRWVRLQASVAGGIIVFCLVVMTVVVGAMVPALAVVVVLLGIALALLPSHPRAAAIAVGVLAAMALLGNVGNLPQVAANLSHPGSGLPFTLAVAFLVLPFAGVVGLAGVLARAPGRVAAVTMQFAGAVLALTIVHGIATELTG